MVTIKYYFRTCFSISYIVICTIFKKLVAPTFATVGRTDAENESENENEIESENDIEVDTENEVVYRKKIYLPGNCFKEYLLRLFLENYISILPKIEKCNLPP